MTDTNVATFPGVETFERRSKFRLEDFNTITRGRQTYRVKQLWPAVGVCFLGGPTMTGKTFWLLTALAKVCRGEPVLGRKSVPAGVVYIGAEDPGGIRLRIEGLRGEIGPLDEDRFKLIGQSPDLTDEADVDDLRAILFDAKLAMTARGIDLGVVAIDTMSAAIPGADENTAKDMSPVLGAVQKLAIDLDAVVIMVAHTGKDAERGLRGWSGLLANADGLIMLEDPEGSPVRPGKVIKVKNGVSGDAFAFTLRVVTVGQDEDGDPITTCVVEEAEPPDRIKTGRTPTKAAASAEIIMRAFGRVWDSDRKPVHFPGADGCSGVQIAALREEAFRLGVGPTEPDPSEGDTDADRKAARRKWQFQRKADFDRGLDQLRAQKRLRTEAGYAWEPSSRVRAA